MGLLGDIGDLVDDGKKLVGDVVEVGKDIMMAPAEIAHWVLGEMFGGSDADLQKIAAELEKLSKELEGLTKEVNSVLHNITWHGPASDAFVAVANGRVKEMNKISDDLSTLGKSVTRLSEVY
ncbi:WXG100 family type VII secretion target [Streptomyces chattanoogensis]|uniref:WXG100 family type VII secretion target n=1 Tax=Streptomyces chattanoogensis TaxID=66876 RepID=UPI0006B456F5|nr:WXG100 family type VII secretion target [Streptomyces chattanoogensis]